MNLQQDCKHLETSSYRQANLFLLLQVSWTIIELELSHPAHQRPRLLKEDQIGQYTRFWHEDFRTNRSVKFFQQGESNQDCASHLCCRVLPLLVQKLTASALYSRGQFQYCSYLWSFCGFVFVFSSCKATLFSYIVYS